MSVPVPYPDAELCADCQTKRRARHRRVCEACRSRKDREGNPARYTFENLKSHAGARGIPFDLSLEAGTRARPGAYTEVNIAILTRRENSIKGNREKEARQARWDRARQSLRAA